MNILGVLVRVRPDGYDEALKQIEDSGLCEVHFKKPEEGKVVVTIEGADDSQALGRMRELTALERVLSADMIHLASESEPEAVTGEVPAVLHESIDANLVRYGGSVHNWLERN